MNRDPRGRVVSVAYLAVVPYDLEKGEEAEWFTISTRRDTNGNIEMLAVLDEYNNSIELAFDHKKMLIDALDRLKNKVLYTDVVLQVLPSEFTLRTAQDIYETLAGKEIPSFRRYIKDKVEGTGCIKSGAGHRPSELYRVKI